MLLIGSSSVLNLLLAKEVYLSLLATFGANKLYCTQTTKNVYMRHFVVVHGQYIYIYIYIYIHVP